MAVIIEKVFQVIVDGEIRNYWYSSEAAWDEVDYLMEYCGAENAYAVEVYVERPVTDISMERHIS